jgi:hypothetical protein
LNIIDVTNHWSVYIVLTRYDNDLDDFCFLVGVLNCMKFEQAMIQTAELKFAPGHDK